MKKPILLIIIAIVIAIVIFIGYYPPFFPFLKHGFLSQPATKVVFQFANFSPSPEENFSLFLQEIDNIVRQNWHSVARLAVVSAFFVPETNKEVIAYELQFFSDSDPILPDIGRHLLVSYNADLFEKKRELFPLQDKPKFFHFKYHEARVANNRKLVATECIDPFACQFMIGYIEGKIKPVEILISGKQAFKMAAATKPELLEKDYIYEGEPEWFAFLTSDKGVPLWTLLSFPNAKIDARNGENFL